MVKWWPFERPTTVDVEAIVSVRILASATGLGKKLVHRWERPEKGKVVTHIAPVAYFRSPFEPRVVMLFERKYMGAEDETSDTLVVGVHLERGFQ